MPSESAAITAWLVFLVVGQWSLLFLLFTFFFVKHLPSRENPFLVNFLLTTFLGTIPPTMLLYTGHQSTAMLPPANLCFAQAALVDGVPPMFGVAQLALVINTWSEVRSLTIYKRRITRSAPIKYMLLITPYLTMWTWVFISFIAGTQSRATPKPGFGRCVNDSAPSNAVRGYVGVFMLIIEMIELAFGLCVGLLLYRFSSREQKDSTAWKSNLYFSLRLVILSFLQIIAMILIVGSAGVHQNPLKVVYELLSSMNALATFFIIATQRSILQAWKICRKTEPVFEIAAEPFPTTSTEKVTEKQRAKEFEAALEHRVADEYFKPWLNVGAAS